MHVGARESLASGGGGVAATRRRGEYLRIHTQTRRGDQREVPAQKSKRCATLAQLRCDSPPHVAVRAATSAARSPPPAARAHARTRTLLGMRLRGGRGRGDDPSERLECGLALLVDEILEETVAEAPV